MTHFLIIVIPFFNLSAFIQKVGILVNDLSQNNSLLDDEFITLTLIVDDVDSMG